MGAGAPSLLRNVLDNLKDGMIMAMAILPSILSLGLLGLVLAKYTPVFDILGYSSPRWCPAWSPPRSR